MNTHELAQQFIDALHTLEAGDESDVEPIVALFSADAELSNSALRVTNTTLNGQDGATEFWRSYRRTFGEVRSEFAAVTTSDDAAGLFWTTTGTNPQGASIEYDGATLLMFNAAGQITRFSGYYDSHELGNEIAERSA